MSDRVFFGLMAAAGVVLIGLAAVWPQGIGARSPAPFGQVPVLQTPAMQAAMARAAARAQSRMSSPAATFAGPSPATSQSLRPSQ
jgi:hypothetical protein